MFARIIGARFGRNSKIGKLEGSAWRTLPADYADGPRELQKRTADQVERLTVFLRRRPMDSCDSEKLPACYLSLGCRIHQPRFGRKQMEMPAWESFQRQLRPA
jgi:hypothetical protein